MTGPLRVVLNRVVLTLAALVALAAPSAANAASRLMVTLGQPAQVYLDGEVKVASGDRVTVNHIAPGTHLLEFHSLTGEVLDKLQVTVPADTVVQVRWSAGAPVQVQGGAVAPAGAPPPVAPAPDAETVGSKPPEAQEATSFDVNDEGTASGQRAPSNGPAGNSAAFRQVAGTAARVGLSTVAPAATAITTTAAPALVRGTANMVRSAEAGGAGAFRGGSRAYQGRPVPPAAKLGRVVLINEPGDPTFVVVDGFVVARFAPGTSKQTVTLEVGRHTLEFQDAETLQPLYKGVVTIEEGQVVQLQFSDAQAPVATERTWAWSPRSL